MAEELEILDEEILVDELGSFPVKAFVEISDSEHEFIFHMKIWDGRPGPIEVEELCVLEVPFSITNPMLSGLVMGYATHIGICVGTRVGWFTIGKGIADYRTWKETYPDSSVKERIWAMATKFQSDSKQFRDEIKKVLIGCLTFGAVQGGGGGEPGGTD